MTLMGGLATRAAVLVAAASCCLALAPQAQAENASMCASARRLHWEAGIAKFCAPDEIPPEMEQPHISRDVPVVEEPPARPQPSPPRAPVRSTPPETSSGCRLTGLWPYAGNCQMDEIRRKVDEVFPAKGGADDVE